MLFPPKMQRALFDRHYGTLYGKLSHNSLLHSAVQKGWGKIRKMSALNRRIVNTTSAPAAIGPYSQSVVVDRTMYISGQLGLDVASGQLVDGGVQAQAKQALINMGEILKAAGCDYTNVVKTTVLLADINDFNSVNEVYKTFFSSNFPARAAYQVAALPRGGLVEIEAIAVLGPLSDS